MHGVFYFSVVPGWTMSLETKRLFLKLNGKKAENSEVDDFVG